MPARGTQGEWLQLSVGLAIGGGEQAAFVFRRGQVFLGVVQAGPGLFDVLLAAELFLLEIQESL